MSAVIFFCAEIEHFLPFAHVAYSRAADTPTLHEQVKGIQGCSGFPWMSLSYFWTSLGFLDLLTRRA
jgi:hypothetical protein